MNLLLGKYYANEKRKLFYCYLRDSSIKTYKILLN